MGFVECQFSTNDKEAALTWNWLQIVVTDTDRYIDLRMAVIIIVEADLDLLTCRRIALVAQYSKKYS